jgi:hypothetical protein
VALVVTVVDAGGSGSGAWPVVNETRILPAQGSQVGIADVRGSGNGS